VAEIYLRRVFPPFFSCPTSHLLDPVPFHPRFSFPLKRRDPEYLRKSLPVVFSFFCFSTPRRAFFTSFAYGFRIDGIPPREIDLDSLSLPASAFPPPVFGLFSGLRTIFPAVTPPREMWLLSLGHIGISPCFFFRLQ